MAEAWEKTSAALWKTLPSLSRGYSPANAA
jgi:hypothetical protein